MRIKLESAPPLVEATLIFDALYEEELRLDLAEKKEDLEKAACVYLYVDDLLAGETYGIQTCRLEEEIPDVAAQSKMAMYCCSTTVLPAYVGKGLAKIMKAYWLGRVREMGYSLVIGHSTSPEMKTINCFFGAFHFDPPHKDWYGTGREAWFYKLRLP